MRTTGPPELDPSRTVRTVIGDDLNQVSGISILGASAIGGEPSLGLGREVAVSAHGVRVNLPRAAQDWLSPVADLCLEAMVIMIRTADDAAIIRLGRFRCLNLRRRC